MVRSFINLFLSLILPIGALFTAIATLYYLKDFELGKAIKLGVVTGILSAIAFSMLVSTLIMIKRAFQIYHYQRLHTKEQQSPSRMRHTSVANRDEPLPVRAIPDPLVPKEGEQRYILLMDYDVAFEVALYAIESQKIGILQKADKRNGEIIIQQRGRYVPIKLSRLSTHSSQIILESMENTPAFIRAVKEKEFAFLDYE